MKGYLGIDTSNYTTSTAVYCPEHDLVLQKKKLLPVPAGALGLRQSDAVFHHTVQLPQLLEELSAEFGGEIRAVAVSNAPRDAEGSYMPCFLAGMSAARAIASFLKVPLYFFSHQSGHIAAALYSAGRLSYFERPFYAFHVSGGTTEALLVRPNAAQIFEKELLAQSLDLKAGQAIDRVGGMLGLPFPAGAELDRLAQQSKRRFAVKPSMKGANCCLSGIQNQCQKMLHAGECREDIARFCIESVLAAIDAMAEELLRQDGTYPFLFAGGVMSNRADMRIKKKTWILTFESTTQAMAADKFGIEQKLPGRLIPIPREITAGCGLCWKADPKEREKVLEALQAAGYHWEAEYILDL